MADAIYDAMLDLLHDGDIGETNRALSSDNGNAYEEQTLHLGIMKIVHVTVPSIEGGEEGLYDASLVPDPDTLDLAVLTVFTNLQQSKRLISRLQGANSQHFRLSSGWNSSDLLPRPRVSTNRTKCEYNVPLWHLMGSSNYTYICSTSDSTQSSPISLCFFSFQCRFAHYFADAYALGLSQCEPIS